ERFPVTDSHWHSPETVGVPMNSRNSAEAGNWMDVTAVVVQLSMPGTGWTMSRVVTTLDPQRCNDLVFLERLFARIERLRKAQKVTREEERLLRILESPPPRYGEEKTRNLPEWLTDNVPCLLADVPIEHANLPPGCPAYLPFREMNLLPCRAEKRAGGRVVMLPCTWGRLHYNEEYLWRYVERHGVRLSGARVQANSMLYEPQRLSLPGLVLISFERDLPDKEKLLLDLADDVYDLKERRPRNRDEEEVRSIVMASEERGLLYRRRLLPRGYTGGPEVYAADLFFRPHYLRHRCLTEEDRLIPCVAEVGPKGGIEHVPYWEFTGETAPKAEEIAEVVPVDAEPARIYASRRSVTSGATAPAEAIQAAPANAGGWIDVTADVLAEPSEEVEPAPVAAAPVA